MCYYLVMNDFGFKPNTLNGLVLEPYLQHNDADIYDKNALYYGNTNVDVDCSDPENPLISVRDTMGFIALETGEKKGVVLDWLFTNHLYQDLRMG